MSELPRKAQDRVNAFGVVLIGMVSAVLLWVSVVALQAYYYSTAGEVEGKRASAGKSREMRDLKAQQRAELQEGKYVDPKKGIVTIPVDDATKLVLRDAKQNASSLVPAVGAHDQPTIPAISGRPPDTVATPAPPAGGAAPPAGGAAPPAGGAAPPAGGAAPPAGGAAPPAGGAAPPAAGTSPSTPTPTPTPAAPDSGQPPEAPASPPATPTPPGPSPNP